MGCGFTEEYLTLYKQINVLLASNRMYQRNDSTGANQGNSLPLFTSNTKEMLPCQRRHNACYQQQFGSSKVREKKVHVHAWSACCNGQNHAWTIGQLKDGLVSSCQIHAHMNTQGTCSLRNNQKHTIDMETKIAS
jgi:hypothetical protein